MVTSKRKEILRYLEAAAIPYRLSEHEAAYTVADMDAMDGDYTYICKNLFLRDKKKRRYFLVMAQKDKRLNLKSLAATVGLPSLHFAAEEELWALLNLTRGTVSPCGLLYDKNRAVEVLIDNSLCTLNEIGVHPNDNCATIWLSFDHLLQFIKLTGHQPQFVDI